MRILIYTGKGGVGKTSVAAATACHLASSGRNVLVMSTDQAHSLGDSLDVSLGNDPKTVFEGLAAVEADTVTESRKVWGHLHDYIVSLADTQEADSIEIEEVLTFPGMEELLTMLRILDYYEEDAYDALIVDCAPTGRTLSLLRYPEILESFMQKMLSFVRTVTKIAGPAISKVTGVPKPEDIVFEEFDKMIGRLTRLESLLSDQSVTTIRIVTTPEHTVIDEAIQNNAWMQLYHFPVDALIINRIYPDRALSGYFEGWREVQAENTEYAKENFSDCKIWQLELMQTELRGIQDLKEAAGLMYGEEDPLNIFLKN